MASCTTTTKMRLAYILLSVTVSFNSCVLCHIHIDSEELQDVFDEVGQGLDDAQSIEKSSIDWKKYSTCRSFQLLPVIDSNGNTNLRCGQIVPLQLFAEKPGIGISQLGDNFKDKNLALIMVDPDAPSRSNPKCRCWLHWIVTNIISGDGSTGREDMKYNPPAPPSKSGFHRYFFLLYEQTSIFKDKLIISADRCGFNVDKFVKKYDLKGPLALNMFQTKSEKE